MDNYKNKIYAARDYIRARLTKQPEIAIILGSGLGDLAKEIADPVIIPYQDIPHFPVSTVEGHAGQLVIGGLEGKIVACMQGRFHYYEGYSMKEVTFPIRVFKALGINVLVVTNAAGGMNRNFKPGDLMIMTDHINFMGDNPLLGPNDPELGPRFPDMSEAYRKEFVELGKKVAADENIDRVQSGVYVAVSGPNFETPAELNMLSRMGADAVGMSTVPEVIVANHAGVKVFGVSCITDMAIADDLAPLEHEQVMAVANATRPRFIKLIKGFVREVKL